MKILAPAIGLIIALLCSLTPVQCMTLGNKLTETESKLAGLKVNLNNLKNQLKALQGKLGHGVPKDASGSEEEDSISDQQDKAQSAVKPLWSLSYLHPEEIDSIISGLSAYGVLVAKGQAITPALEAASKAVSWTKPEYAKVYIAGLNLLKILINKLNASTPQDDARNVIDNAYSAANKAISSNNTKNIRLAGFEVYDILVTRASSYEPVITSALDASARALVKDPHEVRQRSIELFKKLITEITKTPAAKKFATKVMTGALDAAKEATSLGGFMSNAKSDDERLAGFELFTMLVDAIISNKNLFDKKDTIRKPVKEAATKAFQAEQNAALSKSGKGKIKDDPVYKAASKLKKSVEALANMSDTWTASK